MRIEAEKLLCDILQATAEIRDFTRGFDLSTYRSDARANPSLDLHA